MAKNAATSNTCWECGKPTTSGVCFGPHEPGVYQREIARNHRNIILPKQQRHVHLKVDYQDAND